MCKPSGMRDPSKRTILHVDLDSFFVSVALKKHPQLQGKPVAVCHAGRGSEGSWFSSDFLNVVAFKI